jgi:propionyl-CoA synthetase
MDLSKYITYGDLSANDFINEKHDKVYRDSIDNQEAFFDKEAKRLHWFKPY